MLEFRFNYNSYHSQNEEVLTAILYMLGFEGFWNERNQLKAYIDEEIFNQVELDKELKKLPFTVSYFYDKLVEQNWNAAWEQSYEPVIINNSLIIRAPFHQTREQFTIELIIQPKMSFGTGHHPTTRLIALYLLTMNLKDKTVIDAGCGTGILSILAEKLGSSAVYAFDIDPICVENTKENSSLNNCNSISVYEGTIHTLTFPAVDVIIANINRNVLLDEIPVYAEHLVKEGIMILSGFVQADVDLLVNKAFSQNLSLVDIKNDGEWYCLIFKNK